MFIVITSCCILKLWLASGCSANWLWVFSTQKILKESKRRGTRRASPLQKELT